MFTSVYELIQYLEAHHSDHIAFQWVDNDTEMLHARTYAQFVEDIRRFTSYASSQIPNVQGAHVAIIARNSYDYCVTMMGLLSLNAFVVPLNIQESWQTIQEELDFVEAEYVFHDGQQFSEELAERMKDHLSLLDGYHTHEGTLNWAPEICPDDGTMIIVTSGTTSRHKYVEVSTRNLLASLENLTDLCITEEDQMAFIPRSGLHMMPLYHGAGIMVFLVFIFRGKALNLCTDLKYLYRDNQLMHSEFTFGVPMILEAWQKDIRRGHVERLGSIKGIMFGGAASDPEMTKVFEREGIAMLQTYGMSEAVVASMYNPITTTGRYGSVGRHGKGLTIQLMDGEVCFKGDAIMKGYYKDPEATAEVIQDGWLHTGDLGYMDEDGYLYLTGRKKNLIILSSGENVSPEELESLLLNNAAVKETVVKEKNGKILAEIFCEESAQEALQDYVTELNRTLPMYKRMTLVEFRDEPFPRTSTGKIKRH